MAVSIFKADIISLLMSMIAPPTAQIVQENWYVNVLISKTSFVKRCHNMSLPQQTVGNIKTKYILQNIYNN